MKTLAPCILCGRSLDETGDNQPSGGLAFECHGHYPSAIFDNVDSTWLEINICEPCLHTATVKGRVLIGDRPDRRFRATYKIWKWPR